jgi:hypothetical protein
MSLFHDFIAEEIESIVNQELFSLSGLITISISYSCQLLELVHPALLILPFANLTLSIEGNFSILFFNNIAFSISISFEIFLLFQ